MLPAELLDNAKPITLTRILYNAGFLLFKRDKTGTDWLIMERQMKVLHILK